MMAVSKGKYTSENIKRFHEAGQELYKQGFTDISQLRPVEMLGYELAAHADATAQLTARAELAERRLAIAVEAVEHYADGENWGCRIFHACGKYPNDKNPEPCVYGRYKKGTGYKKAQAALKDIEA